MRTLHKQHNKVSILCSSVVRAPDRQSGDPGSSPNRTDAFLPLCFSIYLLHVSFNISNLTNISCNFSYKFTIFLHPVFIALVSPDSQVYRQTGPDGVVLELYDLPPRGFHLMVDVGQLVCCRMLVW